MGELMEIIEIAGLSVAVWRPEVLGPKPTLVFSHGYRGNNQQSTFLMERLADEGYMVFAPNHQDAESGTGRPETPFTNPEVWSDETFVDRALDVSNLLAA